MAKITWPVHMSIEAHPALIAMILDAVRTIGFVVDLSDAEPVDGTDFYTRQPYTLDQRQRRTVGLDIVGPHAGAKRLFSAVSDYDTDPDRFIHTDFPVPEF